MISALSMFGVVDDRHLVLYPPGRLRVEEVHLPGEEAQIYHGVVLRDVDVQVPAVPGVVLPQLGTLLLYACAGGSDPSLTPLVKGRYGVPDTHFDIFS